MKLAARQGRELVFAILALDKNSAPALRFQIYLRLRDAITKRHLPAGTRLPSTRQIAQRFNISRTTVSAAIDMLAADGLVETRGGSGTYVAAAVVQTPFVANAPENAWQSVSKSGLRMRESGDEGHRAAPRCFVPAMPSLDDFPVSIWSQLTGRMLRLQQEELLSYAQAGGYAPLREAIAAHARLELDIECDPAQIIIVDGGQQAIDILARLLIDPGDAVWIEDPGEQTMALALSAAGAEVVAVRVDAHGMRIEEAIEGSTRPRLVHLTPAQHWPLGGVLSRERREKLLAYANTCDTYIIEDDFNAEFRFAGSRAAPLFNERPARVVRLSSFSLTLFPGLRLGYMIVPPALIEPVLAAKRVVHRQSGLLQQGVLALFMLEGHYGAHLRRVHQTYAARRAKTLELLTAQPLPNVQLQALDCGLHIVLEFSDKQDLLRVTSQARELGIILPSIFEYTRTPAAPPCALLGFGGVPEREISKGLTALRSCLPNRY